ncbi:helix-turn-helix domain-containing protein [Zongyangia hominis]|uniref:Helix-turn-helix transcriptional regulator n=1 Tax=Zongyangia hominis TaxID=2763677 RepID=A0A926EBD7_9FIRM|nr:helix-turn-helix transcriptional regulator [Zongyangia hominis]MBC8570772.1 helix-turn-helix transcriptional regulator [Zongyangia hominis]
MFPHIRSLREDRDLTQQQLADYLHISQATYSRYENGEMNIPNLTLKRLALFYNVSIDYLLEEEEDKT